jgi:hypothetical protein
MLTVKRRHREFRVGTLKRRDSEEVGLVVIDASRLMASTRRARIPVYECAEGRIGEFRAKVVLKLIGSPDQFSQTEIEQAVDAYCRAAGIDPEAEWLERQAEWLESQRKEAGLAGVTSQVSSYTALNERYGDQKIPYHELLSTPEWLERRAAILDRDGRRCVQCNSASAADGSRLILQVHHRYYVRAWLPWAYPADALTTLCVACHEELHKKGDVPECREDKRNSRVR